jgi:hypothetical protein
MGLLGSFRGLRLTEAQVSLFHKWKENGETFFEEGNDAD